MTNTEKYIAALKNYKKIDGTIDDAIVIAETLLMELEIRDKEKMLIPDDRIEILSRLNFKDEPIKNLILIQEGMKLYREYLKNKIGLPQSENVYAEKNP
jgi:hypothetical protein